MRRHPNGGAGAIKGLRRGEMVEVRSATEILATLDEEGATDALPFMTEMVRYCGNRFVVDVCASKVCDTIKKYHSRRIPDTVLLEGQPRCDGSAHGGCQAECRLFWKESWLRRIDPGAPSMSPEVADDGKKALMERISRCIKQTADLDGRLVEGYRCQATELYKASMHLGVLDPRPYVHEFTNGNVQFGRFLRITARAFAETLHYKLRMIWNRLFGGSPNWWVHLPGTCTEPLRDVRLELQPGELVQVKTREEIAATLDSNGIDRGLWFDREMFPFCGGTFRVRQRVTRFIDDRSCRMIEFKKNYCVTLEGAVCSGDHSLHRYFCPRAIYPYWRESWLRRVGVDVPETVHDRVVTRSAPPRNGGLQTGDPGGWTRPPVSPVPHGKGIHQ